MKNKKIGLTLGKFAPLHKGHQYMIETALAEMDELVIFIYEADQIEIPLNLRARWLKELYPDAIVYEAWDGPQEIGDTYEIGKLYEKDIIERLKGEKITHFYSSAFYGKHISQALGAVNRQIDPSRVKIPISATMIRENPYKYKEYMEPLVYKDMIIKIVFLGAPSTGKSTITKELAKRFDTVFMPEYGREYWEKKQIKRRLQPQQLVEIARGHIEREDILLYNANRYLFVDTNAITTYMFAMDYHEFVLPELENLALKAQSRYDIYFICCDDIDYDDTWDRSGKQKRYIFQKQIISDLKGRKIPYIELRGSVEERVKKVQRVLKQFKKYNNLAYIGK